METAAIPHGDRKGRHYLRSAYFACKSIILRRAKRWPHPCIVVTTLAVVMLPPSCIVVTTLAVVMLPPSYIVVTTLAVVMLAPYFSSCLRHTFRHAAAIP